MSKCKCCGGTTAEFGRVDSARTCLDRETPVFPATGRSITYLECQNCGFIFTVDFDELNDCQIGDIIYNEQYVLADPDFAIVRPRYFADLLTPLLRPNCDRMRALDYGGGNGKFASILQERGFHFNSHDPYFNSTPLSPQAHDLVTMFEVVEHSRDPLGTFRAALVALAPDGAMLFSTLLRPASADASWWYIAPRNGHVSLHSVGSLTACARALGLHFVELGEGLHLFHARRSGMVSRSLLRDMGAQALYRASLRGIRPFWQVAASIAGAGQLGAACNLKHVCRALLVDLGLHRPSRS